MVFLQLRFGGDFGNRKTYGAVRCGFSDVVNPTARFGAILSPTVVRFGAVFQYRKTNGAMRCGAVFKRAKIQRFGAVRLTAPNRTEPLGKTHVCIVVSNK